MLSYNEVRREYEKYSSRSHSLGASVDEAERNVRRCEASYIDAKETGRSSSTIKKARKRLEKWLDIRDEHLSEQRHYQRKADELGQILSELEGLSRVAGSRIPVEIAEHIMRSSDLYQQHYSHGRR